MKRPGILKKMPIFLLIFRMMFSIVIAWQMQEGFSGILCTVGGTKWKT